MLTMLAALFMIVAIVVVGLLLWRATERYDRRPRPATYFAPATAPAAMPPRAPGRIRRLYRTEDGRADYAFSFEQQPGGDWRIYIADQPGYGSRSTNASTIHRLHDGARPYICWAGRIATFEDAERIAATWADNTQTYIRTGRFAPR